MTWKEIKLNYPNQTVAVKNVIYDSLCNIISADVFASEMVGGQQAIIEAFNSGACVINTEDKEYWPLGCYQENISELFEQMKELEERK